MGIEEFKGKYNRIVERAFAFSEKSRREGLLALEDEIDEKKLKQRDVFEWGIRLTVDGTDFEIIDRVLTNIINLEEDSDEKVLKNIQKEAVLGIQTGWNSRLLFALLNSHVRFGFEDVVKKYLE
jgi:flagellar motor component MotA